MKIKDERIIQTTNKLLSESYLVVLFLLVASVLLKTYVLDMHFTGYVVELGIIVLSVAYIAIRSIFVGISLIDTSKRGKVITVSAMLVLSLSVSIVNGIRNYSSYGHMYTGILDGHFLAVLAVTFISSLILLTAVLMLLYWLNRRGQRGIEKKINDDNDDEYE